MYQIFAGCKPMEKLDVKASYTIAYADELTIDNAGAKGIMHRDDYVTYLWTGDYFKGTDSSAKIDDNYLIMHKLTLMF
jgi:hypothetical protein